MVLCFSTKAIISENSLICKKNPAFDVRLSNMKLILQLWIFFATMDLLDKWRLLMKKGKIIQDIKTNTSWPVLISTLFYVLLAFLFIEGGLWIGSELVGPFSLVIGFLVEFFSPGNGTASIQEFFYHYLLYYELFSFVIILFLFIFWVKVIEKNALSSLGFVKRELAQVSRLGDLDFPCSNGSDRACLPSEWNWVF